MSEKTLFFREAWNSIIIFRELWKGRFFFRETWSIPPLYHPQKVRSSKNLWRWRVVLRLDRCFLCSKFTKWQRNNCKGMREIQWAQVTVSKQYREHAFRKPPSTTMDGGWIKESFDPWQRSLFVPPVSSAKTKEKGPLLAGNGTTRLVGYLSFDIQRALV